MWNHFFDFWGNRINVASEVSPFHGLWLGCNENISKPQIKVLKLMESVWKLLWIFEFPKVWVKRVAEKVFFSVFLPLFLLSGDEGAMLQRQRKTSLCCQQMTTWHPGHRVSGVVEELLVMILVLFDRCIWDRLGVVGDGWFCSFLQIFGW